MSSAITNAGEALLALKQNQEAALVIDTFILANVEGVDPAADVDRTEGKPDAGDIVLEYTIPGENKGYINPNQVVYSMLLGSDIGDFTFNWVGLYSSADDTVVAIAYTPELSKWKTAHPTMGNALTRNFMLEYSGIKNTTQITVEASTWQIDFTARLKGIDERERLSNRDIYGGACFFGDGYLVINDDDTFKVLDGIGYVEGIRIQQDAAQVITPTLPADVFLDVALQPQGSDRVAVAGIVYADPGDYVDGTNDNHYGQKIAEIAEDGTVTDCRPVTLSGDMGDVVAEKGHKHLTDDVTDLLSSPHTFEAGQRYTQTVLTITDGAVTWDCKTAPSAVLYLTEDVTQFSATSALAGGAYDLTIIQDGTGGRSCATPAAWLWPGGEAYEPTTDAEAVDRIYLAPSMRGGVYYPLASVEQDFKAVS